MSTVRGTINNKRKYFRGTFDVFPLTFAVIETEGGVVKKNR